MEALAAGPETGTGAEFWHVARIHCCQTFFDIMIYELVITDEEAFL